MTKKILRESLTLKAEGLNENRFGWVNDLTNQWEIEPILTYHEAICFDWKAYNKEIAQFKKALVKRVLKSKEMKNKVKEFRNADILQIKTHFGVKDIKNECLNYCDETCHYRTNKFCIKCSDISLCWEEKGGYNE